MPSAESHTHESMPVDRGDVIGHLFRDHGLRSNVLGHKKTEQLRRIHAEEHKPEPADDDPCPCGKSHTRSEHGYDPDAPDPDDPRGIIFYNVNEEGLAYERFETMTEALVLLNEFPNDTIVVCTVGSPTDQKYSAPTT